MMHNFQPSRNPIVASAYSMVFPGLGQFYNGETADGIAVWSCITAMILFSGLFPVLFAFFAFSTLGAWLYGILDAGLTAHKINVGKYGFDGPSPLFSLPAILCLFFITALMIVAMYPGITP
jgi:TM2 domain-containing membrane protein YozV